ncbi:hypothetical protein GCM10028805_40120 [Spirosoma harenae]
MKTNFLKFTLSICLIVISIAAMAQRDQLGTPEERATRQTARLKEVLKLSPEQETSVAEINLKYAKQAQPLIETGGRNLRTLRDAKSIAKNKDREMKEVLNKDQYKQYQTIKEEMRTALREHRKQ